MSIRSLRVLLVIAAAIAFNAPSPALCTDCASMRKAANKAVKNHDKAMRIEASLNRRIATNDRYIKRKRTYLENKIKLAEYELTIPGADPSVLNWKIADYRQKLSKAEANYSLSKSLLETQKNALIARLNDLRASRERAVTDLNTCLSPPPPAAQQG